MAEFLDQHAQLLSESAVRVSVALSPTAEDVENQFLKILEISESGRPAGEIVRELGYLATMVQILTDPSAIGGHTHTRRVFSDFADENFNRLVAVREPMIAAFGDINPRPVIQEWSRVKYERYRYLSTHIDQETGSRIGSWDALSVPFAQLQLSFSSGVNATANLWIYAYRAVGDIWIPQKD
jgi:hypothetical protein